MENEIDYKQAEKDVKKLKINISKTINKLFALNFEKDVLEALLNGRPRKSKERR